MRLSRHRNHEQDDVASLESCDEHHATGRETLEETATERETLARRENRVVFRMKMAVILVLLLTSAYVCVGVYFTIRGGEQQNFHDAFLADAGKVVDAFYQGLQNQIEALDALSVAITSHAVESGAPFPNVGLPDFPARFANARVLSGSFMLSWTPLVTDTTRSSWERFSIGQMDNFEAALRMDTLLQEHQNTAYNFTAPIYPADHAMPNPIIRLERDGNFSVAEPHTGPYYPIWHMSPVPPDTEVINLDLSSHPTFAGPLPQTVLTGKAVVGTASTLVGDQLEGTANFFSLLLQRSQYRNDLELYKGDPMSAFVYPVFDTIDLDNRTVVGSLVSVLYWRILFKNVLPVDAKGVIAILKNTQGQELAYKIVGANVEFLPDGGQHLAKYNHLVQNGSMTLSSQPALEKRSLTSVILDTEHCSYMLHVYPTLEMEKHFVTNIARGSAIVLFCVFLFTSLVFVLYTVAVARRQQVVMDRAVASSTIVSSLFPSQVRDQIYQESRSKPQNHKDSVSKEDLIGLTNNRPIASVYERTTVLFADMVGFTKWSSTREPVEVFELLETLYQAFDDIAVRRGVFKVETIGDCYVAVTGLPDPQENHAVIMVKFADECMSKMKLLTEELAEALGADTATLTMRVGMHSGSVTGGVLRGQKSRFQLFGDTMNTASRMESNGIAGRIHVSQETVDELIAKGKSHWNTRRKDKIVAKGKGELQTYWVSPRPGSTSDSGTMSSSYAAL
jgi:class 3 adenylate cyclase